MSRFAPQFGGFWRLKAYQAAEVICGFTVEFCRRYGDASSPKGKAQDKIVKAAKAASRAFARAMSASAVATGSELGLMSTARAHLEEVLNTYQECMRKNRLPLWSKDDPLMKEIRSLAYQTDRTWKTYASYLESMEKAANCALCLTHQTNYLLDQQIRSMQNRVQRDWSYRRAYR